MTSEEWAAEFRAKFPKPVDFSQAEYEKYEDAMTRIAEEAGYKFVGFRLERSVFSSKSRT